MKRFVTRIGVVPVVFAIGLLLGSALTGVAFAYQTHMQNALHALQRAQTQLQAAIPDKAGHRANAINLVNQAIGQVNSGIAAGAK